MVALADIVHSQAADHAARQAITCPKCGARFAWPCQSTGGGNYTSVPTHRARRDRITGWDAKMRQRYGQMVLGHRRRGWDRTGEATAEQIAEADAAAKPIPAKVAKQPTPKGVRLSEMQAEEIERAAWNNSRLTAGTGHFHGEAAYRQTIHALRDKGILAEGSLVNHGHEREYTLTPFGWDVYRQHRLIIHRTEADRCAALNQQESR